ncbi:N-acetylglucosamine-1-phosphodiester alpha-N-acetylglucosaminidase-like [Mercenaria mercenaria]|uniref:N-acetylglucosamine-1-phosphodiester alpha-N-acetylglucosaminidase-like n=1 Tax=Mercenaria mercenaria TaxID=6596 RepID=UPI00234F8AEC|nr:N-acetylglucosamine-1-phosphodiester alpha-N-acetylglucosaminidase-like [Mercenaria mercenaria]
MNVRLILFFPVTICLCEVVSVTSDLTGGHYRLFGTESSDDILGYPYKVDGIKRVKRNCKHYAYGHKVSNTFPAHGNDKGGKSDILTLPIVDSHHTRYSIGNRDVLLHIAHVHNPVKTVSVYEPLHEGTCKFRNKTLAKVKTTAEPKHCLLATNAGLFNTHNGACYGNIVSDGRLVQDTEGIQNAHFGITKSGQIFTGYLSEIDLVKDDFLQLVGGAIWVLKDGKVHVDESIASECRDTEETGTLQRFSSVVSARTLVGHDEQGRVMIMQVEGKTGRNGVNLYEAADIMKEFGAINAINLDGGGSSTLVINNTLVNVPSDRCGKYHCARKISTILCVHEPHCISKDCSGHGICELGECHCHGYWKGVNCDILECPGNCNKRGVCTEVGCVCLPGFHGKDCSSSCKVGWYGNQCDQRCQCENNASCDSVSGRCSCEPGYSGRLCQYRCKLGYYGDQCSSQCECEDSCMCNPVTGGCNYTYTQDDYLQAGACFTKKLEQKRGVELEMIQQQKSAIVTVIITSVISFISVTLNVLLLCKVRSKQKGKDKKKYKRAKSSNGNVFLFHGKQYSSFTSSTPSDECDETALIEKPKDLPS